VAIYEQKPAGDAMHYVYTDYLGSLRCITDVSGNVEQKLGFDAWGNRRDPITGAKLSVLPSMGGAGLYRGFTGHEHLDEFGLINMNGRIYDPMLGMFISPDNNIQAADFTQNFNRYTYALNNPLMYNDPDGEFWNIVVGAVFGGLEGGFEYLGNGRSFWEGAWKGALVGAVTSAVGSCAGTAVSSALGTSSTLGGCMLNGAITGAAAGFASGFAGSATSAWLNGASFENGLNRGLIGGGYGAIGGGVMGSLSGIERYDDYWEAKSNRYWTARGGGDRYTNLPNKYKSSSSIDPRFLQRSSPKLIYSSSRLTFSGQLQTYSGAPQQYVNGSVTWQDIYSDGSIVNRDCWEAVSGPWKTPIANGNHTIQNGYMGLNTGKPGYISSDGGADFYIDIFPDPSYEIHPDGNVFGTNGCIGLEESGVRCLNLYNRIQTYTQRYGDLPLIVSY
jgi:RHS repeat-associated protein